MSRQTMTSTPQDRQMMEAVRRDDAEKGTTTTRTPVPRWPGNLADAEFAALIERVRPNLPALADILSPAAAAPVSTHQPRTKVASSPQRVGNGK